MEEFFKMHNFVQKTKIQNRRFNIIRYYPKIQTYEFVNVGIVLYDNKDIFYRLIQEDEISKLHCPSLIKSKILRNSLESLDKYLQDRLTLEDTLKDITNRYKNTLDTSFQLVHSGEESSTELVDKLFYDYIGYKFDTEEKETKLQSLIRDTEIFIKKEFKNLKVKKSKIHGYSLDFLNIKTNNIHHSLLGSIENSENVARAFLNVPANTFLGKYDFLNTRANISDNGINNKEKLSKLQINVYSYTGEEDIARYCQKIV